MRACDPLAAGATTTALATLIGAGRAADGTIYVLDRGPVGVGTSLRAFVSDGSTLRRRNITGAAETPAFVTASLGGEAPLQVKVELVNGAASRMSLFRGPTDPKTKTFEVGVQGEELMLVSATELASFTPMNESTIEVTYAATTNDGRRFLTFAPTIDRSENALRIFFGPPDRMIERRMISISQDHATHLIFDLDGVETKAELIYCGSSPVWGAPRLEPSGAAAIPLTPVPGSAGAQACPGSIRTDLADGGADAGTPAPSPRAEPATLVAGLTFTCF